METTLLEIRRRVWVGAFAVAVMMAMSGCTTVILRSNLDQYTNNASLGDVGSSIPGPPEGDRTTDVQPDAVVTSGGTNLLNGPKLRVTGTVSYRPAEHTVPDRYQILWRGLRDNHLAAPTVIRLLDSSRRKAVELRFEDGQLSVSNSKEVQGTFATDRTHEASILINMRSAPKTVRIVITQQLTADPIFNSPPLELLDEDFSRLDAVQIESASGVNYFVQDLRVLVNN